MKKAAKTESSVLKLYATIGDAAKIAEVKLSTFRSGIARGEVATHELAGGTRVVLVSDAKRWAKEERKSGPKPRKG